MYDVPGLGVNYRMSEMQAALGRSQLARVEENLARRRANFETLKNALSRLDGVRVLDSTQPEACNSHYSLTMVLEKCAIYRRNDVVRRLQEAGIGTSIYYPQPVPRMSYYRRKYGYDAGRFPTATEISDHSLALPVGPHLSGEDVAYIAERVSSILEEASRA
jgi:dTDP-4-amino-4,6-dideoxygalactose transaminase